MHRVSISSWKLPIVIHNIKGYDGHLIVKALKSEFVKVRIITQNMEKYLSLRLWTNWNLSTLSNSLLNDYMFSWRLLQMTSAGMWWNRVPLIILVSSNAKVSIPMTIWIASTDLTRLNYHRRMRSSANCLVVLVQNRSIHTQLECGLPLDEGQWQITTTLDVLLLAEFFEKFRTTFLVTIIRFLWIITTDMTGGDMVWQDVPGHDGTWQDVTGPGRAWHGLTGRDRMWHGVTGPDRTWQDATRRDRTWQDVTGRDRTWQDVTGHVRAWQDVTWRGRT